MMSTAHTENAAGMLHVIAVIPVKSEHLSLVSRTMTMLAAQSRVEPGCVRYDVFQRKGEPVLITQETWTDAAAEAAHLAGANVAAALAVVSNLLAAAPQIHRHTQIA